MKRLLVLLCLLGSLPCLKASLDTLEAGFEQPPAATKPWCYWYWISDNLSAEGITHDLEAMSRVGIGEALIGNIFLDDVPAGRVKVLTPEWWRLIEHAIREGGRLGVDIGLFNCPGWSQSGGPWIAPTQTMRFLVSSEVRVTGPTNCQVRLPIPGAPFQDVTVLAFRAPQGDADTLKLHAPTFTPSPAAEGIRALADGDANTVFLLPPKAREFRLEITVNTPLTARSLALTPGMSGWSAKVELLAEVDGAWRSVKQFRFDRSNLAVAVGPLPRGPVAVSFPPVTAGRYRLEFKELSGPAPGLAEVDLSGAARLEGFVEKQLGKMHPTPTPLWDAYLWPPPSETDSAARVLPSDGVSNVTSNLSSDGVFRWAVPEGDWVILRTGMTPTGMSNAPASPEGRGLEVDKMSRAAAQAHFDAFIGEVLRRMPVADRQAFKHVVADSYEMGSQNWTDGFAATFRNRYGYDPLPWLPVLTGRIVGSVDRSERFLWDLRRLIADRVACDYVGGLRDACRTKGLELWLENYGHWGFPAEFLQYGGQSDRIGGEFWATGDLGSIECRAASSAANIYGKPVISAEAFTGGPAFQSSPASLKARGDWAFCEGINHFVLHVYIHQPWADRVPGVNAWFGTEFNRHNTWFEPGKAWVDYLRRCCFLLQQGNRVADVAYFIGEDVPKMTGIRDPALPAGCDFDYLNAEVLLGSATVDQGFVTLPHGTRYRYLVLPKLDTMRPEVLRKLAQLVNAGATLIGLPPKHSPSNERAPSADAEVATLAGDLWGLAPLAAEGERRLGAGRILWGRTLEASLASDGIPPDFASSVPLHFTHRRTADADLYFVANPEATVVSTHVSFRAGTRAPEIWWPDSGKRDRPASYDVREGRIGLPLHLGPHGSAFVIFRQPAEPPEQRVIQVEHEGRVLPELAADVQRSRAPQRDTGAAATNGDFTLAVWALPSAATPLPNETASGIHGLGDARNDALVPPHGNQFGDGNHAGVGLAIGRNGMVVTEHGGSHFAPVVVLPRALTNWTHVAVVYRAGEPTLYLNGQFARRGQRSRFIAHPGTTGGGGNPAFQGALGRIEVRARPLEEAELADLMRTMPKPSSLPERPALQFLRRGDSLEAIGNVGGPFILTTAAGSQRSISIPEVPAPLTLGGPWEVTFQPPYGQAWITNFPMLADWQTHDDPRIRFHSGKATYRMSFELPEAWRAQGDTMRSLDLGRVRDLATVRLNGKEVGTLWLAPWTLDVTRALQPGVNTIEVDVFNTWNNRLVGDAALPPPARVTFLTASTVKQQAPLQPAGLVGPVRILGAVRVVVKE